MRFAFIAAEKANYSVSALCRNLEVQRSGFYAWQQRGLCARERANRVALVHIRAVHRRHRGRYGSPRVYRELKADGLSYGRHRVARLMRSEGLRGITKRRFRQTTDSNHSHRTAPNRLARQFAVGRPNEVWLGDITYLATAEGWLYFSCFLDVRSRRAVGWTLDDTLDAAATCRALENALQTRAPPRGLVVHSDRGVQYAGEDYQRLLRRHGLVCSMSRKGNCWDNAPMESFFGTLKRELGNDTPWPSKHAAAIAVSEYINYYNHHRRHSVLDFTSPAGYEDGVS